MLWERQERIGKPARLITLGTEIVATCGQTREEVLWRGISMCVLAEWLTTHGYNVGLNAVSRCVGLYESDSQRAGVSLFNIELKSPIQPLDLGSLLNVTSEIGWGRIALLRAKILWAKNKVNNGLGYKGVDLYDYERDALGINFTVPTSVVSRTLAIEWIGKTINKISEG